MQFYVYGVQKCFVAIIILQNKLYKLMVSDFTLSLCTKFGKAIKGNC